MATAQELFEDYNYYRVHTQRVVGIRQAGGYIRYMNETPERLAAFHKMALWCAEREYDARHWLCWLFYRGKWRFARPFNQLIPGSKRKEREMATAYRTPMLMPMFTQRLALLNYATQRDTTAIYDGNRDLAATTEALKRRYLRFADPEGCMGDERSNGYHPRSLVCARCSLAQVCEQRLRGSTSYDIMALRQGVTTVQQVQQEVACRGGQRS